MRRALRRTTAWLLQRTLVRALLHYAEHAGPRLADAITYRALFSVFAGVLLGFTAVAAWLGANPEARAALVAGVDAAVPGLVGPGGLVDPATVTAPAGLTVAGALSLIGLVGTAIGAVSSTRAALQALADRTGDDPTWIRLTVREMLLAVAVAVAVAVSSAVAFFGARAIDAVRAGAAPSAQPLLQAASAVLPVLVVFGLDMALVALLFVMLSGVRAPARAVASGAALGAVGLTVLQELSGLFVGGASANPLLASFASLVALLLWMNLSAQVVLIAGAHIIVATREHRDRVRARYGARTLAERRAQQAEDAVAAAVAALDRARAAVAAERAGRVPR